VQALDRTKGPWPSPMVTIAWERRALMGEMEAVLPLETHAVLLWNLLPPPNGKGEQRGRQVGRSRWQQLTEQAGSQGWCQQSSSDCR
jgi:hypothetical protein